MANGFLLPTSPKIPNIRPSCRYSKAKISHTSINNQNRVKKNTYGGFDLQI